jgi:hypothetical protein
MSGIGHSRELRHREEAPRKLLRRVLDLVLDPGR